MGTAVLESGFFTGLIINKDFMSYLPCCRQLEHVLCFNSTYSVQPTPGPPPAELYQPQGGITYYNTEEQNIVPRPITQKRQRSAIPIVPPPDRFPRGRGRTSREGTSLGESGDTGERHSIPPLAASPPPTTAQFEDAPSPSSTTPTATKVAQR